MAITDDGARSLIAAILKAAHDDYLEDANSSCPKWCSLYEVCENRKNRSRGGCEAKKFIHSAWSATLCDGIGVNHSQYVTATVEKTRIFKETFKFIECELRNFKKSMMELEQLKKDIILETHVNDNPDGTSYDVGNPTMQKTMRIMSTARIKRLETLIKAIKEVYNESDSLKQELIKMKYWENRYKDGGIADILGVGIATFYRWKKEIIIAIAKKLGYC